MNKREERRTELESVKKYLEKGESSTANVEFPLKFLEPLILDGLRLDLIQPGRVVFSMNIPHNSAKYLHGGALVTPVDLVGAAAIPAAGFPLETGVSVQINVSVFPLEIWFSQFLIVGNKSTVRGFECP
ncbi:unnamed protein product [Lathyrus sativus]|nr:unnamed protein product [Lathyrus sativus]